jgi:hypothetical protein
MIRAVVIRGNFDDTDWLALVAAIRAINDRHRSLRTFEIVAVDPDMTALDLSREALAVLSDKPVGRA